MIGFAVKGDFSNTIDFLKKIKQSRIETILDKYGKEGVRALSSATPVDTGKTSRSWYYKVERKRDSFELTFFNSNIQNGVPIAVILQYGHGTGTGGWVEGRDYINPAIQPIFDKILKEALGEVDRL